jgi:hypothetical protein
MVSPVMFFEAHSRGNVELLGQQDHYLETNTLQLH